jgi:hypothetical protein
MTEVKSSVLFGEDFEILENRNNGLIKKYILMGMKVDRFKTISSYIRIKFQWLSDEPITLNSDLVEYVTGPSNLLIPIPLGASLSFINNDTINTGGLEFEGSRVNGIKDKS